MSAINQNDFVFLDRASHPFRIRREVLVLELMCWNPGKNHWVFVKHIPNEEAVKFHANALPPHEAEKYTGGVPFLKPKLNCPRCRLEIEFATEGNFHHCPECGLEIDPKTLTAEKFPHPLNE